MRILILLAIFYTFIPRAMALQNANQQDMRDIAKLINKMKAAEEAIKENEEALRVAKKESVKKALQGALDISKKSHKDAAEKALWLTIRAYDIIPFDGNNPILPNGISFQRSPEMGKGIVWIPVFETKRPYKIQNPSGTIVDTLELTDSGNTASDGVSRIFPEAFQSPVELASLIFHEKFHFEQSIDPIRGPSMTPGQVEVAAYKAEKSLMENGPLVFTDDERLRQEIYLKDNLTIREKQARRELAKKAAGQPVTEASIVSHTDEEIDKLIQQAKSQIVIAQRDHDERLKGQWVTLSHRSCANPGSVSQDELDALPRPHKKDAPNLMDAFGNCRQQVYLLLSTGASAEEIRQKSTRIVPVNPFQPTPIAPPAQAFQGVSFGHILPDLQFYAEMACRYQGHMPAPASSAILTPPVPHTLLPGNLDAASNIAASLGRCEGHVFRNLFEMLRAERGAQITSQWFSDTVRSAPAAGPPPTQGGGEYSPPQTGGGQGGGNGNRGGCWVGDDPFGCQRRR